MAARAAFALARRRRVAARNLLLRACARNSDFYALWIDAVERPQLDAIQQVESASPVIAALSFGMEGSGHAIALGAGFACIETWETTYVQLSNEVSTAEAGGVRWFVMLSSGWDLAAVAPRVLLAELSRLADTPWVYWDHDRVSHGRRSCPRLTPSWNKLHFLSQDYIGSALAVSTSALTAFLATIDHVPTLDEIKLAMASDCRPPVRLPHILSHHDLEHREIAVDTRRQVVAKSLGAGWKVATAGVDLSVRPMLPEVLPSVTVIVLTRDCADLLEICMSGIDKTQYAGRLTTIIVDNGSTEPATLALLDRLASADKATIIRDDRSFNFAALNNLGARQATGDYLCLLNNDIECIDDQWLLELMAFAMLPTVGAVGACLLYPDRTIQHAGVTIGIGNAAGHAHRDVPFADVGYHNEHRTTRSVMAVTAACLVVARDKFMSVGGFDADGFAVAFNDVDFCLRLRAAGFDNIYVPSATLIHHESKSRGSDFHPANIARYRRELSSLQNRWQTQTANDPFHHPNLSRSTEQYVLGWS